MKTIGALEINKKQMALYKIVAPQLGKRIREAMKFNVEPGFYFGINWTTPLMLISAEVGRS